jgi:hypothetical protein
MGDYHNSAEVVYNDDEVTFQKFSKASVQQASAFYTKVKVPFVPLSVLLCYISDFSFTNTLTKGTPPVWIFYGKLFHFLLI